VKWRFIAAIVATTFLVLLVQDVPLGFYLRQVETDRLITSLERDAFVLAGRSAEALESATPASSAVLVDLAHAYQEAGGARVVIVDAAGLAVVTSDETESAAGESYLSRPEIESALAGNIESGHRFSDTLGFELLYVSVPVVNGQQILGAVRLTYPEQVVTDAVNEQLWRLAAVVVTTVLLAGAVGWIISSGVTRRLALLRASTELLARGDLTARADESVGPPEIRSLSHSFNRMAARLQVLVTQQRSFAADASHQLRTPLTALKLRLERAGELLPDDPETAATRLAAAEVEADRLLRIIEGLLLLNRVEGEVAAPDRVDLASSVRARTEYWQALAFELDVTIRFEGPESSLVLAVETAVDQVLDNFVDNALSASPPNSELVVLVREDGKHTSLHVLDAGPGLSPADREQAFERFWRGDRNKEGSGLGLAIVARLMLASGGQARLDARPEGGLDAVAIFRSA
jgi:signal transduction histidine kinase